MEKIYEGALKDLRKSFDRISETVQSGVYSSRRLLGDELLQMKEVFDRVDHHLTNQSSRPSNIWICPDCGDRLVYTTAFSHFRPCQGG